MALDFDTFLVALYTIVDDLYYAHFAARKPRRRGRKPRLTDSEVLTIVIVAQWFGPSERELIRYAQAHWRGYFPQLLSQSATNRRARDLAGVLVHLVPLVGAQVQATLPAFEVLDGVPVPLMRRCRGNRHRLFADEADIGRAGSDRDWYYGCKLLLGVSPQGVILGFILGSAGTGERWLADAFFCWRGDPQGLPWDKDDLPPSNKRTSKDYVGPKGPIWPREGVGAPSPVPYVTDGGFSGPIWTEHWAADYGVVVLLRKNYQGENADAFRRQHSSWRQVIETVNGQLEDALHLLFPRARSRWGLLSRIAAKLVALNVGIWLNRLFGRPDFAHATLFSF